MIRLILFIALSYCFNKLAQYVGTVDWILEVSKPDDLYLNFYYVALPVLALIYARSVKWVFSFNKYTGAKMDMAVITPRTPGKPQMVKEEYKDGMK